MLLFVIPSCTYRPARTNSANTHRQAIINHSPFNWRQRLDGPVTAWSPVQSSKLGRCTVRSQVLRLRRNACNLRRPTYQHGSSMLCYIRAVRLLKEQAFSIRRTESPIIIYARCDVDAPYMLAQYCTADAGPHALWNSRFEEIYGTAMGLLCVIWTYDLP